jgi:hypothetical protein
MHLFCCVEIQAWKGWLVYAPAFSFVLGPTRIFTPCEADSLVCVDTCRWRPDAFNRRDRVIPCLRSLALNNTAAISYTEYRLISPCEHGCRPQFSLVSFCHQISQLTKELKSQAISIYGIKICSRVLQREYLALRSCKNQENLSFDIGHVGLDEAGTRYCFRPKALHHSRSALGSTYDTEHSLLHEL